MQPLLGLHGHIHEVGGIRRIGRTVAINPGSDYGTGVLNGALHDARAGQGRRPPAGPGLTQWPGRRRPGLLVAIDVGTSGARAAAFDLDGRRLLEARRGYPTRVPRQGWAEQDARAWRSAAIGALGRSRPAPRTDGESGGHGDVRAIGLTGQCPSVVIVDARGEPVSARA